MSSQLLRRALVGFNALFVWLKFRQPKLSYPSPPRATCVSGFPVDDEGICAAHGESACVIGRAA